jgi:hypothetical protein
MGTGGGVEAQPEIARTTRKVPAERPKWSAKEGASASVAYVESPVGFPEQLVVEASKTIITALNPSEHRDQRLFA